MPRTDFDELNRQTAGYFQGLQGRICAALEALEHREGGTARFREDTWQHSTGGGGVTRVLVDGTVFEKAGVNFSHVTGSFSEELAATMPGIGTAFSATGISLVIHPRNPHVPTVHANFRHISKGSGEGRAAWFGGGADLTPYYPRREDVIHFHRTWKEVCERHPVADHARFKKWCDEYFYLPHRGEARGVGGIFFDYLTDRRSEEHTSEPSHGYISYAVFCLKKKKSSDQIGSAHLLIRVTATSRMTSSTRKKNPQAHSHTARTL